MFLLIFWVKVFILSLSKTCSFYIQREEDGDTITGKLDYCSGSTFCQCINSTFLDYVSEINCGNKVTGCSLLVAGNPMGIYTLSGMPSYNLTLITGTDDAVCLSEPTLAPIFYQDFHNGMIWNPSFSDQLQKIFLASIKDFSKIELKVANHLEGLFLKIFIDCDNKQQCITIKFEGLQEYPLNPDSLADLVELTTTLSPVTETTKIIKSTAQTTFKTSLSTSFSSFPEYSSTLATMPTTSISVQNITKMPSRIDAISLEQNYVVEIVIGVAVFLLLLVFLLICVLSYKRRRRKSIFKVSETTPVALQNNLASIIRMESNSLSTTPSKLNNIKVKSLCDEYHNHSLKKSKNILADESTKSESLLQSHINPLFKPNVAEKKRLRSVSFSSPLERSSRASHLSISLGEPLDNESINEDVESVFNENIEFYEGATFHYNENSGV
ncbi:uncharacterized protein LOC105846444 isoform X1 [Hydra vulgaris]|uniref:Uncharacterized protein LOC105846444 isoform X1 n=1 Tax=Hydra vulgaris TaxID=6087 RepID=A0ABM4DGH1_HYDVU